MDEEFLKSVGELLAEARQKAGLSQRQLAKIIGTSQPWVCRAEAGSMDMRLSSLARWAEAVGFDFEVGFFPKQ